MSSNLNLQDWFGSIDIYLFDQLLKGRFVPGMRLLDAGCGGGGNLNYFFKTGFDVCATHRSPQAIFGNKTLGAAPSPNLLPDRFWVGRGDKPSVHEAGFYVVI